VTSTKYQLVPVPLTAVHFSNSFWAPRIDTGGAILDLQTISQTFTEEYRPDLLGGVTVIHGKGYAIDGAGWQDELYREEAPTEREVEITAVPYCVWDNRAPSEMRVWLCARNR
jgi:uncharacterized protein